MNITAEQLRLYAVTDRAWVGKLTLPQQVEAALKGGVTCVQLREKQLDEGDFFNEALEIQKICRYYHVPFLLNDNVPLALRCGADGVHVGQDDMSAKEARRILGADKIIGVSAHDPDEAKKAYADGADYLGCAVYATPTKGDAEHVGLAGLAQVVSATPLPVVAIGGINQGNVASFCPAGAAGVAVVSAIFAAADPRQAACDLAGVVAAWPHHRQL